MLCETCGNRVRCLEYPFLPAEKFEEACKATEKELAKASLLDNDEKTILLIGNENTEAARKLEELAQSLGYEFIINSSWTVYETIGSDPNVKLLNIDNKVRIAKEVFRSFELTLNICYNTHYSEDWSGCYGVSDSGEISDYLMECWHAKYGDHIFSRLFGVHDRNLFCMTVLSLTTVLNGIEYNSDT